MREAAITVLAFTDSGWTRRVRVGRRALVLLAASLVLLVLTGVLSAGFAGFATPRLRRLGTLERENRSLATQLKDQVLLLDRLQSEMSSLRQVERSLRVLAGLPDRVGGDGGTGRGGGTTRPPRP